MYVHKEVFAGVYAAIQRLDAPVKKAWTDAMSEKGVGEKGVVASRGHRYAELWVTGCGGVGRCLCFSL